MFVRLLEPYSKNGSNNWLIQAEGLRDPAGWTHFVPSHGVDSDRFLFEKAVKEVYPKLPLTVCKHFLRAGLCCFEYDWLTPEEEILEHALHVAELLRIELVLGNDSPLIAA